VNAGSGMMIQENDNVGRSTMPAANGGGIHKPTRKWWACERMICESVRTAQNRTLTQSLFGGE
jgi:hypothetical protein